MRRPSSLWLAAVAVTLAPVGAVIGEFVASNAGLGHLLIRAVGDMDTPLHALAVPDADRSTLRHPEVSARELTQAIVGALGERMRVRQADVR